MAKCDALFSLIIRSRGGCEARWCDDCPAGGLQAAHGFSRRYQNTRYDEANAWSLCAGCHILFTHNPLLWDDWMRERLGRGYEEMRAAAQTPCQRKASDWRELHASLKARAWELDLDA
jgi:hypothetical protein